MKKVELESKLRIAEKAIRQLDDQLKRSGTLDEQMTDIERQIGVAEAEASADIDNRIQECEEKTGRKFTYHRSEDSDEVITLASAKSLTFKGLVKHAARKAASSTFKYKWKNPCDFRKWAEPIFTEAWNDVRKGVK